MQPDRLAELESKVRALPQRSISPSPESMAAVRVEVGGVDFRMRRRLPGWIWVPLMALASAVGTGFVAYYESLKAAGARVAAIEEKGRLQDEHLARLKTLAESLDNGLNHEASVNRSQEKRLDGLGAGLVVKEVK